MKGLIKGKCAGCGKDPHGTKQSDGSTSNSYKDREAKCFAHKKKCNKCGSDGHLAIMCQQTGETKQKARKPNARGGAATTEEAKQDAATGSVSKTWFDNTYAGQNIGANAATVTPTVTYAKIASTHRKGDPLPYDPEIPTQHLHMAAGKILNPDTMITEDDDSDEDSWERYDPQKYEDVHLQWIPTTGDWEYIPEDYLPVDYCTSDDDSWITPGGRRNKRGKGNHCSGRPTRESKDNRTKQEGPSKDSKLKKIVNMRNQQTESTRKMPAERGSNPTGRQNAPGAISQATCNFPELTKKNARHAGAGSAEASAIRPAPKQLIKKDATQAIDHWIPNARWRQAKKKENCLLYTSPSPRD